MTFQKNESVMDENGNHKNTWTDWFTCWATAVESGISTSESEEAAHMVEGNRLDITVRYCTETAPIDSTHYRIMLKDRIYDIVGVSDMGFKHESRLFHAKLVER